LPATRIGGHETVLRRNFVFGLAAGSLAVFASRAFAQPTAAATSLKAGEFIWRPHLSPGGPVVIVVSLPRQLVHVYRNGLVIAVSTCSTGMVGHRTPTGVFTILQKRQEHYSSTYNNAPMPNMQRLTWRGIALHAGQLPGYPASHGCIRLPLEFSRLLFSITGLGTSVIIADHASAHKSVVEPSLVLPSAASVAAKNATENSELRSSKSQRQTPPAREFASILVSAADRKAYLIVDGVAKFATPIDVVDSSKTLGTHLYSLIGPSEDGHSLKWNLFDIDGDPETGTPVDLWSDRVLARIDYLDAASVRTVAGTLRPGTTMVVTDSGAGVDTRTDPDFTIIAEDEAVAGKRVRGNPSL
jgi:hypothetical protein